MSVFTKNIFGFRKIQLVDGQVVEACFDDFISYVIFSFDRKIVEKIEKCLDNEGRLTKEDHLILGNIYGFPKKAVEMFANEMGDKYIQPDFKSSDKLIYVKETKNKPYYLYATYVGRKNHPEDFEVAKEWWLFTKKYYPEVDTEIRINYGT